MLSKQEYHVVVRPDAKHFPEVAKGDRCICLEPEISIMVGWCQVAPLTAGRKKKNRRERSKPNTARLINVEKTHLIIFTSSL